jgi:hypothetical protein
MEKKHKVIAKLDCLPHFKIGDKAKIVVVLYTKDHIIHDDIYGRIKDGKLDGIIPFYATYLKHGRVQDKDIVKVFDKLIAPKGSVKKFYIELSDGTVCPEWPSMRYSEYFEKV